MKLINKKTGKKIDTQEMFYPDDLGDFFGGYKTLTDLNDEWKDYEETKTAWYIDPQGNIREWRNAECDDWSKEKAIGNYFETKEEAEKAVEKLKAWKRLKDKGLTFCGWKITEDGCSVDVETTLDAEIVRAQQKYITDDLVLLFGGENE